MTYKITALRIEHNKTIWGLYENDNLVKEFDNYNDAVKYRSLYRRLMR